MNNKDYGATGFFAPKPIFDQRQAFVLYSSAQPDIVAAEDKLAAEPNTQYKGLKEKYERSRETVTRTGEAERIHNDTCSDIVTFSHTTFPGTLLRLKLLSLSAFSFCLALAYMS